MAFIKKLVKSLTGEQTKAFYNNLFVGAIFFAMADLSAKKRDEQLAERYDKILLALEELSKGVSVERK